MSVIEIGKIETNDRLIEGVVGWQPLKPLLLRATLTQHNAFKSIHSFNPAFFGTGTNRGENFQARADVVVNRNWMGHIMLEKMFAGDFYLHKDPAFFFRGEIIYTLRGVVNGPKSK